MLSNFAIFDLGAPELIIILIIILLLFGGKKLPQLSRSIGDSLRELRRGVSDVDDEKQKESKRSEEKHTS